MAKLTDRSLDALRPRTGRYEIWDDARKGFGVRVTPRGVKSFVWVYHFEGKPRRMTFGTYPRISLADAGVKLAEAKQLLDRGVDPGSRLVSERAAERSAETVGDLVAIYLERYARPRKRSASEDERILRKDVLSRWENRKAKDISRRDVVLLLNEIVDRGAPIQANRTLTIVRRMFRFAIGQAIIEVSPCDEIERPSAENQGERVLSEDEIRLLWKALETAPMEPNARRILRAMLATGQRKGELIGLPEREIDKDLWLLPVSRAKNGREHLIPLSPIAMQILLFPSARNGQPYRGQSIDHATRYLFDPRPRSKRRGQKAPETTRTAPPPLLAGVMERFTPHDLRRTVATRMRELGISRGDVKMVLNHTETDVTATYDRYDGLPEKRRALVIWGSRLEQIVAGKSSGSNVVQLASA
jgi:integrase